MVPIPEKIEQRIRESGQFHNMVKYMWRGHKHNVLSTHFNMLFGDGVGGEARDWDKFSMRNRKC